MIEKIKAIIDSMGIPFRYGNPSQINYYLNNVDYAAAPDGVAAYCYLLTDSEYVNGKERATIAVFFSKLIDIDFNGSEAVSVTDDCKAKAKEFLHLVATGNTLNYTDSRLQYGYGDFADNVAWCAVRAVFEVSESDCWPLPDYKPGEVVLEPDSYQYVHYDGRLLLIIPILTDGVVPLTHNVRLIIPITDSQIYEITSFIISDMPEEYERFDGKVGYFAVYSFPDMYGAGFNVSAVVSGVQSNSISVWIPQE